MSEEIKDTTETTEELTNTVLLSKPIEYGQKTIEKLVLREMTAKDMRTMRQNMTYGDLLDIGARLSNQPKTVIDRLSARDANELIELVGKQLDGGN